MKTSHYYHILGVSEDAGIREIKNAFRRKAKNYHPDINKSPDAHDKFIDINEAYTFLINLHSSDPGTVSGKNQRDEYYRHWVERERQKERARAARRARMRFEEFRRSSIYRTTSMLSHMLDYFMLFIGFFIIIAGALGLYKQGLYIEENGDEIFNSRGIVAIAVILISGTLFILLSWSNILTYRKNSEKYKKR